MSASSPNLLVALIGGVCMNLSSQPKTLDVGATYNGPNADVLLVSGLILALKLRHLVGVVEKTVRKKT